MVLAGCRQSERRLLALGYPVYRYKLVAFVLADAYRDKFGGDHIDDARAALASYCERISWIQR